MKLYSGEIQQYARANRILHDVTIELTYKCNLDCFFCYNDRQKKGQPLSLPQYQSLLEDLAEMQTMYIMFTGGEPMVHPHFFEIGSIAKNLGFAVRVRTNGHSLSKANVSRLKREVDPFYIEVSLHGASAETHDRQTRIPGSFDRLIKNIKNCQDEGLDIRAVSTPTLWNEDQIDQMIDLCDSLNVSLQFQGPVAPRDNGDLTPLEITPKKQTWDKVAVYQAEKTQKKVKGVPRQNEIEIQVESINKSPKFIEPKATCSVGVAGVDIDPYGNVQACMHLQESAGNLHEASIRDIWDHSPLFTKARERSIEAAKKFENKEYRQLGAHVYCLAVEENLNKSEVSIDGESEPLCGN